VLKKKEVTGTLGGVKKLHRQSGVTNRTRLVYRRDLREKKQREGRKSLGTSSQIAKDAILASGRLRKKTDLSDPLLPGRDQQKEKSAWRKGRIHVRGELTKKTNKCAKGGKPPLDHPVTAVSSQKGLHGKKRRARGGLDIADRTKNRASQKFRNTTTRPYTTETTNREQLVRKDLDRKNRSKPVSGTRGRDRIRRR